MRRIKYVQAWWLRGWRARLAGPLVAALSLMAPPLQAAVLVVTNLNDSGPGSLRQTIADAASGDTITFSVTGTIVLTSGELTIAKDLTIDGPGSGPNLLTISGNNSSRVFQVDAGVVAIQDLGIRHGQSIQGGGVRNNGALALANCVVSDNAAGVAHGGAIYNDFGATLTVANCTLSGNDSLQDGGAIANSAGTVTLSNSTLSDNFALGHGGAVFNRFGATLTISGSTLSGNGNEFGNGGAIFNDPGSNLSISSGSAVSNNFSNDGGGIFNDGTLTLSDTVLSDNIAGGDGGGIFNDGGLTISDCALSGNSAGLGHGGGLFNSGPLTMSNCSVSNNLYDGIQNHGTLTMFDTTLAGNGNSFGGIDNQGMLTMYNSTLSGNSGGNAGGINNGGTLSMTNCTLSGNTGGWVGGMFNSGVVTMSHCTLSDNSGALFADAIENIGQIVAKSVIVANGVFALCAEPVTPVGVNFATDNTCGLPVVTSAQLNLGPLANNGGPTQTHALLSASVAIDATPDCTDAFGNPVTIDQRGMPRPQDGDGNQVADCDVGAFEASELTLFAGFDADLQLSKHNRSNDRFSSRFSSRGSLTLDGTSNGIDPVVEPVVLFLADRDGKFFEQTLPPGSFERTDRGGYAFRAREGERGIQAMFLTPASAGGFTFELLGKTLDGTSPAQPPVIVSLSIGDDVGSDMKPCGNLTAGLSCQ